MVPTCFTSLRGIGKWHFGEGEFSVSLQAGFELVFQYSSWNSRSSCLRIPNTAITGLHLSAWLFPLTFKICWSQMVGTMGRRKWYLSMVPSSEWVETLQKGREPGREQLWVLLMDSTDAEKVILEHILEGSPRFWALHQCQGYISALLD